VRFVGATDLRENGCDRNAAFMRQTREVPEHSTFSACEGLPHKCGVPIALVVPSRCARGTLFAGLVPFSLCRIWRITLSRMVPQHPYTALGFAFAVGLLIGAFRTRSRVRETTDH
jgi:hypothetical protein